MRLQEEPAPLPDTQKMCEVRERLNQICIDHRIKFIDPTLLLLAMVQVGNGEGSDFFMKPEKLKKVEAICLKKLEAILGAPDKSNIDDLEVRTTPEFNRFWWRALCPIIFARKSQMLSLSDIMIALTTVDSVNPILAEVGMEISIM